MFDKFVNRRVIEGELVAATAIHIGSAQDLFRPDGCKNPFFRNAQGRPMIPGSSLKGAMRSFMEQYLASEGGKEFLSGEKICSDTSPCADGKEDLRLKELLEKKDSNAQEELANYLFGKDHGNENHGKLCIVCRLFGSRYSAAKLSIRDAKVMEETFQDAYEIRSGVAIDRDTGTSSTHLKFETEVVPEGTSFYFRAVLENADKQETECVEMLLRAMKYGMIPIGGMKSRGLGEIRLENIKFQEIDTSNIKDYLSGIPIPFHDFA